MCRPSPTPGTRHLTPRALRLVVCLALLSTACATWRPLPRPDWERADAHVDVFRTRLRVTRLDGAQLYLEHPAWAGDTLRGVYPIGWPRLAGQDTVVLVPRDSIARVERLESSKGRTALYVLVAGAAVGAAWSAGR